MKVLLMVVGVMALTINSYSAGTDDHCVTDGEGLPIKNELLVAMNSASGGKVIPASIPPSSRAPASKRIDNYLDMFYNPETIRKKNEANRVHINRVCRLLIVGNLSPHYAAYAPKNEPGVLEKLNKIHSRDTSFSRIEDFINNKYKIKEDFHEIYGDFTCGKSVPILYYAVQNGYCENAYGIFKKLKELKNEGYITEEIFKMIILEGPAHPYLVKRAKRRNETLIYNTLELIKDDAATSSLPITVGRHCDWCPLLREEIKQELGMR